MTALSLGRVPDGGGRVRVFPFHEARNSVRLKNSGLPDLDATPRGR
jgi:hypothetical protein